MFYQSRPLYAEFANEDFEFPYVVPNLSDMKIQKTTDFYGLLTSVRIWTPMNSISLQPHPQVNSWRLDMRAPVGIRAAIGNVRKRRT